MTPLTAVPALAELAAHPARARDLPPEVARDLLAQLLQDQAWVKNLPPEAIPALLGELERLKASLWARLVAPAVNGQPEGKGSGGDRLLTVKRAAEKLGCSTDYLYRNKDRLPFTVRQGCRVMFSEQGIERFIRQRMGRR